MEQISRSDAKILIQQKFKTIASNKNFVREFADSIKNRVSIVKVYSMFNDVDTIVNIDDSELYWLIKNMNKFDMVIDFELSDTFTERESNQFELVHIETKTGGEVQKTIVIDDVVEIESFKEYMVVKMPYYKIKEAWEKGVVTYNFETQREGVLRDIGIDVIKVPNINRNSVNNIKQKMLDGAFKSNTITWNILETGNERYDYNEKSQELVFTRGAGSQMNVLDGMHRTQAIIELLTENPDNEELKNRHTQLKIWNFDVMEAQDYINQEASGNALSVEKKKQYDKSNIYGILAQEVNKYGSQVRNVLYNKLGDLDEVTVGDKYCSLYAFSESIEDNFRVEEPRQIKKVSKYLVEFYNEVVGIYKEDFEKIKEVRMEKFKKDKDKNKDKKIVIANAIMTEPNIFIALNYIASKLYEDEDWAEKLEKLLKEIDFTVNNTNWKECGISSIRTDKRTRRKIYDYVRTLVE
jgi:hypothetical protein